MNINIKYPVGYEFYVPRVYERWNKETILHPDSNGILQEWSRDVITLEALVKCKVVDHIEIMVSDETVIHYWCVDKGTDSMAMIIKESDMSVTDPDLALMFARRWRDEQQTQYFGSMEN
jgi:hypothetical protein